MKYEDPIITVILLASIILVFILQNIFDLRSLVFVPAYFLSRPWTFLTAIFMHSNIIHLFFNGFALFVFGSFLEARVTKVTYLLIYFLGGILGNIGFIITTPNPYIAGLGASGAIFGIMGALAILTPRTVVFVMGLPMPMIAALFLWIGLSVFGIIFPLENVAYGAHLFGILAGVGIAFYLRWRYMKRTKVFFSEFS